MNNVDQKKKILISSELHTMIEYDKKELGIEWILDRAVNYDRYKGDLTVDELVQVLAGNYEIEPDYSDIAAAIQTIEANCTDFCVFFSSGKRDDKFIYGHENRYVVSTIVLDGTSCGECHEGGYSIVNQAAGRTLSEALHKLAAEVDR